MLREGRLEIGPHAYFEPGVWLTSDTGRIAIGGGSLLNLNVMIAAIESVSIGEHCMLANGCLVTDGNHRFDDLDKPVPWQGFTTKGPVTLGDNVWLGANVVVTSGVTHRPPRGDRRELRGDARHPRVLDRGRSPGAGPQGRPPLTQARARPALAPAASPPPSTRLGRFGVSGPRSRTSEPVSAH